MKTSRWYVLLGMAVNLPPALLSVISSRDWLPTQLPAEPFGLFKAWFDEQAAAGKQPNPNAMCLATVGMNGFPRGRIVLCRGVNTSEGYLLFYTNYEGDKGRELAANPRASANFHWDHSELQARFEGWWFAVRRRRATRTSRSGPGNRGCRRGRAARAGRCGTASSCWSSTRR